MFVISGCKNLKSLEGLSVKNSKFLDAEDCPSLPQEEQTLLENPEILDAWLTSDKTIGDFLQQKRGSIKGKEFGF